MKRFIVFSLFTASLLSSFAQEISPAAQQPKFSFGFSPFSMLFNKTRFELETGVGKRSPIMISAAPIFYNGTTDIYSDTRHLKPDNSEPGYSKDHISGTGGEVAVKFMKVLDPFHLNMVYFGFGLGYHDITLKYSDFDFIPYEEDGLTYYDYKQSDQKENIKRTDVFALAGGRLYAGNRIYFDLQMGLSYRNAKITSSAFQPREHESSLFDHGYTGFNYRMIFTLGFSIF